MQKVLILTASFGEGHNAAARNLRDALELASDDVQVETLDLLESAYGRINMLVKSTYLKVIDHAPFVWNGIYGWLNSTTWPSPDGQVGFARLRQHLADVLRATEPDCVVTTCPLYAPLIQQLYRDHSERPFRLIDAWEIANRNDLFTPVGHKRLRFIANSDFHKPKHIESWKTLLHCDKNPEAVKECLRENRHVAITVLP